MKKLDQKVTKIGKDNIEKFGKEASAFKAFISRGNVVDMAVGVIIGGAFGKIVTSLVNDMLMPIIGVFLGGLNFTDLNIKVGKAVITYGNFIQSIIDFLIISLCIFIMIRLFEHFKIDEKEMVEKKSVEKSTEVKLLEEIRDLLKNDHK